jgi:hypothetical protein
MQEPSVMLRRILPWLLLPGHRLGGRRRQVRAAVGGERPVGCGRRCADDGKKIGAYVGPQDTARLSRFMVIK